MNTELDQASGPTGNVSRPSRQIISDFHTVRSILRERASMAPGTERSRIERELADNLLSIEDSYTVPPQRLRDKHGAYRGELAFALLTKFHNVPAIVQGTKGKTKHFSYLADAIAHVTGEWPRHAESSLMLISGHEQFARMAFSKDYYPREADFQIARDHAPELARHMVGSVVVELGVGDGDKIVELFKKMRDYDPNGHGPDRYVLVDIVPGACDAVKRRLIKDGFDPKKIHCLTGDFLTDAFWERPVWNKIREKIKDTGRPAAIIEQGVTFNDYSFSTMNWVLTRLDKSFDPGTSVILSIDSTVDKGTVERAYVTGDSREFLFKGFVNKMEKIGVKLDLKNLSIDMSVDDRDPTHVFVRLGPVACPAFTIPDPYKKRSKGLIYTLEEDGLFHQPIQKIGEDKISDIFWEASIELNGILPYMDLYGQFKHVRQAWWVGKTKGLAAG